LTIGALARRAGVNASAIRYYEDLGLMPAPRRCNGRRLYDGDAVNHLRQIVRARALGFGVSELTRLAAADGPARRTAGVAKAATLRAMAQAMLAQADTLDTLAECACAGPTTCALNLPS
jgi:DNA-binding transcriptional MerR regulator